MSESNQNFNKFVSVVFHPIIYPLLVALLSLEIIPRFYHNNIRLYILSLIFLGTILIPIFVLYYLKRMEIIKSFHLEKISERKYPYIFFTIISVLISRILFKLGLINDLAVYFLAGSVSFLLGYWMLLFNKKVSIHTMGIGSTIGFLLLLSFTYKINLLLFIMAFFILFGVIAKARIDLKAHNFAEIILGFVIGMIPQILLPLLY